MSIIEKAAGKLKLDKAGAPPLDETLTKSPESGSDNLIEKAASKLAPVDIRIEPTFDEFLPDSTAADGNKESRLAPGPTPPPGSSPSRQGMIDLAKLRQLGMITTGSVRSQINEEFRLIKRPLLLNAFNPRAETIGHRNLIMITSALADEGKTFCAANLAMSIAMEMDHTVLLVDADVARPAMLDYLGLEPGPGLLDILLNEKLDLADVLIKTNVEKLSVLPAGTNHHNAAELLASHAMSDLLKEIAHRYSDRVVIFDTPPLLLTSEAQALAWQMGQVVLVVEAETTPQKAVMEALRQIESCDIINIIYNKARPFPGGDSYGYYYN